MFSTLNGISPHVVQVIKTFHQPESFHRPLVYGVMENVKMATLSLSETSGRKSLSPVEYTPIMSNSLLLNLTDLWAIMNGSTSAFVSVV